MFERFGEDSDPDWVWLTGNVRLGETPGGAAALLLSRMALEPFMGQMLVHDCRPVTPSAPQPVSAPWSSGE